MKCTNFNPTVMATSLSLLLALATTNVLADASEHSHGAGHGSSHSSTETPFGNAGSPKKVTRTIAIDMTDAMRFSPANVTVKQGETIRFVVTNKGKLLHELVIGTMDQLKTHGETMKMQADVAHDDPSAARVRPGQKGEVVWQFTKAGDVYFACLVPGHFEAGMIGKINVTRG
jgi:uncharacterized cupredoxin-like copper-binding protein